MHHLDHLIALQHGGATADANLVLACIECNQSKGSDLVAIDQGERVVVWYRVLLDDGRQGWVAQSASERRDLWGGTQPIFCSTMRCELQPACSDRSQRTDTIRHGTVIMTEVSR